MYDRVLGCPGEDDIYMGSQEEEEAREEEEGKTTVQYRR
jgi:hypothetical protein